MRESYRTLFLLALLTLLTIAVQGYHFGTDDAAIYVPAIARFAHPQLYSFGDVFFLSHSHLSIFAAVAGGLADVLHLSVAWAVLLCYLLGTWMLLIAAWQMAGLFFESMCARWTAVCLLAALLPVQVAGTAIPIMDGYFTARTLSTPLTLFALVAGLKGKWRSAIVCIGLTLFTNLQMSFYAAVLLSGIALQHVWRGKHTSSAAVKVLPVFLISLGSFGSSGSFLPTGPATGPYRDAVYARTYFFAQNWGLSEWVGVVFPLLILLYFSRIPIRSMRPAARRLCAVLFVAALLAVAIFLVFSSSHQFDYLVRLQPMRIFQLLYIVMFLLFGGLAGEFLFRGHGWRSVFLFLPLAIGMYSLDRSMYPASSHLEWPEQAQTNPWLQAFAWIRDNTPENAVFAVDPQYLLMTGEDRHGFRALTQRSVLADSYKDSGVAAMFPAVAPEWGREVAAQEGWRHFALPDFERLATVYPVTWVAVDPAQAAGLDCRYSNRVLAVCRIPTRL